MSNDESQQLQITTDDPHDTPLAVIQPKESTDMPPPMPQISLTFLLVSGRRRTMSFEPSNAIGRVKELVWNAWPSDWSDERPPSPSYLRVLYLGKILQDEEMLSSLKMPLSPAPPTIVHLSIRQIPIASEEPVKKKKKRNQQVSESANAALGDQTPSGGCCGCVIC